MILLYRWLCPLALAVAGLYPVSAQTEAPKQQPRTIDFGKIGNGGQCRAIIVGVNIYDASIRPLTQAVNDATRFRRTLMHPEIGKQPEKNIRFLITDATDPLQKPTKENIERAIKDTVTECGPNDTVWFFFAGHGLYDNGTSYLLPSDFKVGRTPETAVNARWVRDQLTPENKSQRRGIVILDACQSGAVSRDAVVPEDLWTRPGLIALAACREQQSAWEFAQPPGGIFTYYLIRGLSGEADGNKDGIVTAQETRDYLMVRVNKAVRDRVGKLQEPQFFSTVDDLALTYASATALAQLPESDESDAPLSQEPLGPALLLSLKETDAVSTGVETQTREGTIAEGLLRKALVEGNFPVLDREATEQIQKATGSDVVAAAGKAKALGARFLLSGNAEISLNTFAGNSSVRWFATVTLSVKLVDERGRVLFADVFTTPSAASNITQGGAITKALNKLTPPLMEKIRPILAQALQRKPPTP